MKPCFFSMLLFLLTATAIAQQGYADSLEAELKKAPGRKIEFELLEKLLKEYRKTDPAKVRETAATFLQKANEAGDSSMMVSGLLAFYDYYYFKPEMDSCKMVMEQCLQLAKRVGDHKQLAHAYAAASRTARRERRFGQVEKLLRQALSHAKKSGDKQALSQVYGSLGTFKNSVRKFDEALGFYKKSLRLQEQTGEPSGIGFGHKQIGFIYLRQGKYEAALQEFDRAMPYFIESGHLAYQARVYNDIGVTYKKMGKWAEALQAYDKAVGLAKQQGDQHLVARTFNNKGVVFKIQGKYDEAVEMYRQSEQISIAQKDSFSLALVHTNIGNIYKLKGEYGKAIELFQNNLSHAESKGDPFETQKAAYSLANVYSESGNFGLAQKYALRALKMAAENGKTNPLLMSQLALADAYSGSGQTELADSLLQKNVELTRQQKSKPYLAYSLKNLGQVKLEKKDYQSALANLFEALQLAEAKGDHKFMLEVLEGLGKALLEAEQAQPGEIRRQFASSRSMDLEQLLLNALAEAEATGTFASTVGISDLLARYYEYRGDYRSAYFYKNKYAEQRDSVYQNAHAEAVAELETTFETKRKEQENALLKTQNEVIASQNKTYLAAALLLGALLALTFFFFSKTKSLNKKLAAQNLTIEKQNKDLQSLNQTKDRFFGIIAHDLRSPMLAFQGIGKQIAYFIKKEKTGKLLEMAAAVDETSAKLNELLDNLLNWALLQTGSIPHRPQLLDLSDAVEQAKALLSGIAAAKQVEIINNAPAGLLVFSDENALRTIARNLLANAVKFSHIGGTVTVSAHAENGFATLSVSDNGIGIPPEKMESLFTLGMQSTTGTAGEKGTGLGLLLCAELAQANGGRITVESELGKGSTFRVLLPGQGASRHS
ncbi:MAG TPA: tetratricopeptide repeat protein [Bacteroidetes bacterium]|nr:tetratricopeptide repeat protein [Bacteroidota bacterium]